MYTLSYIYELQRRSKRPYTVTRYYHDVEHEEICRGDFGLIEHYNVDPAGWDSTWLGHLR